MVTTEKEIVGTLHTSDTKVSTLPPAISIFQIYTTPYIDSSGVPLASDRAEPELVKDINFEYQACPFHNSPSRYPDGHPSDIPMSGFERRRLAENYPAILSIASQVREGYIGRVLKKQDVKTLPPLELRTLLRALFYLPHYLSNRGSDPIPAQGVLPPAVINLSNSASGTLGAIEAYLGAHRMGKDLFIAPDPDKMIEESEKLGSMVGKQTVCVASPTQMHHFFTVLINGVNLPANHQFDSSSLFSLDEVPSMVKFGTHAYEARDLIDAFKDSDLKTAAKVAPHVRHNPRRYKKDLTNFLQLSEVALYSLMIHQEQINRLLGRSPQGPKITLDTLEPMPIDFKMPALLRILKGVKLG